MSTTPEFQLAPQSTSAIARTDAPPIGAMLEAVLTKGVTEHNVAAVRELVGLYRDMQKDDAKKQFAAAFVALQADMPAIRALKPVPGKNGETRYHFAPYEDIMEQVRPLLQKHGFTVTFSSIIADDRVTQACTLQHVGGHEKVNQSMARIGNGPPGATASQADGAASTYAKRFALCDALNIVVERDSDGRNADARDEGSPITRDQAQVLRELVADTKSDEQNFLMFAGAPTFEEIGSARYAMVFAALQKKLARK